MTRIACCLSALTLLLSCGPLLAQTRQGPELVLDEFVEPFDLDAWIHDQQLSADCGGCPSSTGCGCHNRNYREPWNWVLLPEGVIYKSYLAGVREPRLGISGFNIPDIGWIWEATLGGRVGILRFGSPNDSWIQGFQLDFEAAALARLDSTRDLVATDYRFGLPLTFGFGNYQTKFGYYHVSAHLGDEFLLRTGMPRVNYVRDSLVWGHSINWTNELRVYFEFGYAFVADGGARPWEFQFGADYASRCCTGPRGAPFAAVNFHLREEVNFGGNAVFQVGWQWRGKPDGHLLRLGFHFHVGKSTQYEFFDDSERQIGFGLWYDF